MENRDAQRLRTYADLLHEHEKKELRIIKQAIAKSFITSGKVGLQLDNNTEKMMEDWIKWVYRDEEKRLEIGQRERTSFLILA